jgi:hypothetical protein
VSAIDKKMAHETNELAEMPNSQVDSKRTFKDVLLTSEFVAKVELSTFAFGCRHQQETTQKLYFRGFSGELRTVFRKTSVGL